jgi:hypothetical protein
MLCQGVTDTNLVVQALSLLFAPIHTAQASSGCRGFWWNIDFKILGLKFYATLDDGLVLHIFPVHWVTVFLLER